MNAQQRRAQIVEKLKGAGAPVSASALAQSLGVSRQIVVGDVALLRAQGTPVAATPRGYVLREEQMCIRDRPMSCSMSRRAGSTQTAAVRCRNILRRNAAFL